MRRSTARWKSGAILGPVLALVLGAFLAACGPLEDPAEKRTAAFLRAAYEGNGNAMQDMLLNYSKKRGFLPVDEWVVELAEQDRQSTQPKMPGATTEQVVAKYRREFDAQIAKSSLDLASRGKLAGIDTTLVERTGDWACVRAEYRFADGSTLAQNRYEHLDGKKSLGGSFSLDGHYFLHRRGGKWYVLGEVAGPAVRSFTLTAAGVFLGRVLDGKAQEAAALLSPVEPGNDPTRSSLDSLAEHFTDGRNPLTGWSLAFRHRRENGRLVVVSYEARLMDAEEQVKTADLAVILRRVEDVWEVDRLAASSEVDKVAMLAAVLATIAAEKEQKQAEAERLARLQPITLLEQVRLVGPSYSSRKLAHAFASPAGGSLRLAIEVAEGSAVDVDLFPAASIDATTGRAAQYYPAFRGRGVYQQSFEMTVTPGARLVLSVTATDGESKVGLLLALHPTE